MVSDNSNESNQPQTKRQKTNVIVDEVIGDEVIDNNVVDQLLSIEIKKKPPKTRGRYVTKLQDSDKYERRKRQNREAQRRARERKAKVLTKIKDFQNVIADLKRQLQV